MEKTSFLTSFHPLNLTEVANFSTDTEPKTAPEAGFIGMQMCVSGYSYWWNRWTLSEWVDATCVCKSVSVVIKTIKALCKYRSVYH